MPRAYRRHRRRSLSMARIRGRTRPSETARRRRWGPMGSRPTRQPRPSLPHPIVVVAVCHGRSCCSASSSSTPSPVPAARCRWWCWRFSPIRRSRRRSSVISICRPPLRRWRRLSRWILRMQGTDRSSRTALVLLREEWGRAVPPACFLLLPPLSLSIGPGVLDRLPAQSGG